MGLDGAGALRRWGNGCGLGRVGPIVGCGRQSGGVAGVWGRSGDCCGLGTVVRWCRSWTRSTTGYRLAPLAGCGCWAWVPVVSRCSTTDCKPSFLRDEEAGLGLRVVQLMRAATSGGAVDEEGGRCEVGRWVSKVGCFRWRRELTEFCTMGIDDPCRRSTTVKRAISWRG